MIPQNLLVQWYQIHKRDLPWRNTQDPYIIWLSEVILQQTRVAQGMPYFLKFAQVYPRVEMLAQANQDQILKLWQGLGYYSRARNMHHTAQLVTQNYQGQFPKSYLGLIQLKGIGPYTAAAIASFAFNEPVAVLDGNVFRVISRYFAQAEPINSTSGKKIFEELAAKFLNKKLPALHNQAMMELGSLICTPTKPNCGECPLQTTCKANLTGTQHLFPVKIKKNAPRTRHFNYFLITENSKIGLLQRAKGDIWQNLFELPLIETSEPLVKENYKEYLATALWFRPKNTPKLLFETKHILTHQHIEAKFFEIELGAKDRAAIGANWYNRAELKNLAIARLMEKFFNSVNLLHESK
jgi:A/G-specific adenine glycosylase